MSFKGFWITPQDITTKTKFIAAIRHFVTTGQPIFPDPDAYDPADKVHLSRGELLLWDAIATYFERHTEIPDQLVGISWFVDLHKHLVDAFLEFRHHVDWRILRETYKAQTEGYEIPDLTDSLTRASSWNTVVGDLVCRTPLIAGRCGRGVGQQLDAYFSAERAHVMHTWQEFLRECYRPSKLAEHRVSAQAQFGRTRVELDSASGGRNYIEFARTISQQDVRVLDRITELVESQQSLGPDWNPQVTVDAIAAALQLRVGTGVNGGLHRVTFATAEDREPLGCRFSISTCNTTATNVVAMLEEVIARWDPKLLGV